MTVLTPHPQAKKQIIHMLFLAILLLLYCCATICPATIEHRCIYDSIAKRAGPLSTATVMVLPRRKRFAVQLLTVCGSEWKPIRISVFTEDMNNKSRYCSAVGQKRPNFYGGTIACEAENILTDSKRNIIVNQVIPQAIKLHSERLLVEPMINPIIVPKRIPYICSQFTVPSSHHTKGVQNADMVLYVAASPTRSRTFAWALHCAELDNGRPIVGVINFNSAGASSWKFFVRIAAHEIAHTLGFNFRNFRHAKIISFWTGVRRKPDIILVNSPKVLEKTRAHYNCSTALGMELEDEGGMESVGSHWEMRNAMDELMVPAPTIGYYSALTMALFEDLGFYRANWSMAETMNWGRNAGCELLTGKCVINGTTAYPDMFCTSSSDDMYVLSCTSDRLALGYCMIKTHENPLLPQFQYFDDPRVGGLSGTLTDYCPIVVQYSNTKCAYGWIAVMPGSVVGPSSRCLKGDNLYYGNLRIGDVCAEVRCHKNGDVSVRYYGNNAWHLCPEGESIELRGYLKGKIVCPKYSDVCYETGRDKSEIDLGPMRASPRDKETEQTREVDLFLPGETKVYEKGGNEKSEFIVKSFEFPLLVSADGLMVALAEADSTYGDRVNVGIAARYIGTEETDWVKKALASNGGNWVTQLVMPRKEWQGEYYFSFERSRAVGRGNKIYVLIISQKKDKQEWDYTRYVDWDFELVVGEVKPGSGERGTNKTIEWKTPVTLSALTQKIKEQSLNVSKYGERYGFLTRDGRIVFVVKAFKKNRDFFLIIYTKDEGNEIEWEGTYVDVTEGCSYSAFFEWGGKLIMLPHCLGEMYKAKESNDMGKTWTNVIGPLARIFDNLKGKLHFTTATIGNKTVLLFAEVKKKGLVLGPYRMYLWMMDGSCVRKIGLMTSIFDFHSVTSSGLLYANGESFSIHPHSGPNPKRGIFLLRLKDGLERIKSVLNL